MGSGRGWLAGDWPSTGAFSTLLRQSGLRASTGGVLATKCEHKMLASTCLYSLYAWLSNSGAETLNDAKWSMLTLRTNNRGWHRGQRLKWSIKTMSYIVLSVLPSFHLIGPWRNFARCKLQLASKSCVLLYWQLIHTMSQLGRRGNIQNNALSQCSLQQPSTGS